MTPLPRRPEDVTARWLTRALAETVPGVTVRAVQVTSVHEATNHHATLGLRHDGGTRLPDTVFCKLPPLDEDRRARLDWRSMGRREVRFYRDLAPRLDAVLVPEVVVAALDESSGEFVLIMEDLRGAAIVPDGTSGIGADLVAAGLEDLAELHVRYEDRNRRRAEAPWIGPAGRAGDYGARLLRAGIDADTDGRLAPGFVDVAERYIRDRDTLQDAWERGPTTVLHGDPHIGNLFVAGNRLGFYDWGLMVLGSPLRDVGYLVTMALDPAERAARERDLLAHYCAARAALGGTTITADEAWLGHRLHSAYTVVASCQSIALPPHVSPARRAFSGAFVERAARAVEELEPLAALDRLGPRGLSSG